MKAPLANTCAQQKPAGARQEDSLPSSCLPPAGFHNAQVCCRRSAQSAKSMVVLFKFSVIDFGAFYIDFYRIPRSRSLVSSCVRDLTCTQVDTKRSKL